MPDRVEPCLALLKPEAPTSDDWALEVKWDGYRLAVHVEPTGKLRIITRGGHDWTARFPTIAHDVRELGLDTAILDREAVVLNERGASDFGALQKALGGRGGKASAAAAILYAFDLLYLDDRDLRALPLDERRKDLERPIGKQHSSIRLSEEIVAHDAGFLKLACELGLEGIIAKRRDAPYRPGRGGDWLKIKCVQSETFLIVGYQHSAVAFGGIGRLLLTAKRGEGLVYVGGVGKGLTHKTVSALKKQLDRLATGEPAVKLKRKGVTWIKPEVAAEITYRAWTDDGMLRHASFKGVREAADEVEIYQLDN
jgi:bifunctional non-homologous end joining protein LigD